MDFDSQERVDRRVADLMGTYPKVPSAYTPDGHSPPVAWAAMILGAPVAWLASACVGTLGGALAGIVILVLGKAILWIPRKIGATQNLTIDYLDPTLLFCAKAAVILAGGYVAAACMGKITAFFGRLAKNRSVPVAGAISALSTACFLGYLWHANLQYNSAFPTLLKGGWGIAVGVVYALAFAATALEAAKSAVLGHPFCSSCARFTLPAREVAVPQLRLAETRTAVARGTRPDIEPFVASCDNPLGVLRFARCATCDAGLVELRVRLVATVGPQGSQRSSQYQWTTASSVVDGEAGKLWHALFPKAQSRAEASTAQKPKPTRSRLP